MTTSMTTVPPPHRCGPPARAAAECDGPGACCCAISGARKHLGVSCCYSRQPFSAVLPSSSNFPEIRQGMAAWEPRRVSVRHHLVPGVVGISVMFQGVQSNALVHGPGFGFTRRSRTGAGALPDLARRDSQSASGAAQGVLSAASCCRSAGRCHAPGVSANLSDALVGSS